MTVGKGHSFCHQPIEIRCHLAPASNACEHRTATLHDYHQYVGSTGVEQSAVADALGGVDLCHHTCALLGIEIIIAAIVALRVTERGEETEEWIDGGMIEKLPR